VHLLNKIKIKGENYNNWVEKSADWKVKSVQGDLGVSSKGKSFSIYESTTFWKVVLWTRSLK